MKLFYTLLVTLCKCSPKTRSHIPQDTNIGRNKVPQGHKGIPSTQCINRAPTYNSWKEVEQTVIKIDNDESGTVTVNYYEPDVHCYIDIGSKCNSDGVEVEFTFMSVENSWEFNPNGVELKWPYGIDLYDHTGCYDTVHFAYMSKGSQVETEGQCGCLHRDHPSCDYYAMEDYDKNYYNVWQNSETEMPSKQELIGTDIKLILSTDSSFSGKFSVDWKCS